MKKTILGMALFAIVIGGLVGLQRAAVGAEQVNFLLAIGQGVRVADHMVTFRGITRGLPTYDLLGRGAVVARFPLDPAVSPALYTYGNLSITTNTVSPDGKQATGSVKVE